MKRLACIASVIALTALPLAAPLLSQTDSAGRGGGRGGRRGRPPVVITDTARWRELWVSKDPKDLGGCNCVRDSIAKRAVDSVFEARSQGVMEFHKISFKSRADGLEIPGYLFAPLDKGSRKHAAMVWVHDGIHGNFRAVMYYPFVVEAVKRGYVVIAPEYRGSTGFGEAFYKAIDYGGKEVDDALSSLDYLATLPYVDMNRLGVMGWSHGGLIAAQLLFRDDNPFKAGAAIVPVTNLIFRLSDHGPGYARDYAAEEDIQGLPFERNCGKDHDVNCVDEYMRRSPVFHVANLKVPMLVHVATNDCDVFFREDQQMVYTLMALKPDLAETKIYVDPPPGPEGCGHTFSRRVDPVTLERQDTPEQIDSWNRTWAFFERTLKP
jgi:dipeptidyl aminopeptidase/acylaminoacyl peptidase